MKPHPQKKQIKTAIRMFLAMFRPGDQLRTEDVIKYVHKYVGRYIYGDTILRYLREMREDGEVDYVIYDRQSRIMRIASDAKVSI